MQWMTGQRHKPILPSEKKDFVINMKFHHDCDTEHTVCFPTVSACSRTVTFPSAHLKTYSEFKNIMTLAVCHGQTFDRLQPLRLKGKQLELQHFILSSFYLTTSCFSHLFLFSLLQNHCFSINDCLLQSQFLPPCYSSEYPQSFFVFESSWKSHKYNLHDSCGDFMEKFSINVGTPVSC